MDRRNFICITAAAIPFLAGAEMQTTGLNLEVRISYSGVGAVDAKHKIFVLVWNSPAFTDPRSTITPLATKSIPSKTAFANFTDLQSTPVYVSAVYDPSGAWDATKPPPRGSSLGLYFKQPGTAAPIQLQLGTTVSITLNFDDSIKVK